MGRVEEVMRHWPWEVEFGAHGHIDEQRAEDEQVGTIVDGVLNQSCLHLPRDGETTRACVWLHERDEQPAIKTKSNANFYSVFLWGKKAVWDSGHMPEFNTHASCSLYIQNQSPWWIHVWYRQLLTMSKTVRSNILLARTQVECHQVCSSKAYDTHVWDCSVWKCKKKYFRELKHQSKGLEWYDSLQLCQNRETGHNWICEDHNDLLVGEIEELLDWFEYSVGGTAAFSLLLFILHWL